MTYTVPSLGRGAGPSNNANDFPLGSITRDPNGIYWRSGGQVNKQTWEQLTGKDGIFKDNIALPNNLKADVPWYVANSIAIKERAGSKVKVGPLGGELPTKDERTLRWPEDAINTDTDYVFFQFGKYIPPFSQDAARLTGKTEKDAKETGGYNPQVRELYESSSNNLDVSQFANNIMLPIPQDLSNEIQQVWQGKQFTQLGRAALAAAAGGSISYAKEVVNNITGNAKAIQTALTSTILNSIPGVGGNISYNDVSGSTRGIVINPNAELLYDSPEMREIGMIFRLVPRNSNESQQIQDIVKTFRKAAMPNWGATGGNASVGAAGEAVEGNLIDSFGGEDNWIRVPNLCKFTFMKGQEAHPYLIQFKPCAISRVEVNYTSDGTFATYTDGAPVAVELSLNFMETKLIFADEVERGF
tara:strand:+ start:68 stop:1312 length:1245 start_codon:yes stop_codon:yes gene_type:complete